MATKKQPKPLFICATCGERFTTLAAADRHDPTHHRVATLIHDNTRPAGQMFPDEAGAILEGPRP
jgi:hypothetical protein